MIKRQMYNRKATRTGRAGYSRLNPVSKWVWSPEIVHEPVVSVQEWKQAQEITAALRAGASDNGPLLRIRAAARRQGLTVAAVSHSGTYTLYRIGDRQVVLPAPLPDMVVQQVIDDMGSAT